MARSTGHSSTFVTSSSVTWHMYVYVGSEMFFLDEHADEDWRLVQKGARRRNSPHFHFLKFLSRHLKLSLPHCSNQSDAMPHFSADTSAQQFDVAIHLRPIQGETLSEEEMRAHRIRIKNRRKRYLDLNPDYFSDSNLELAGRYWIAPISSSPSTIS